jgi:hypothetical protein
MNVTIRENLVFTKHPFLGRIARCIVSPCRFTLHALSVPKNSRRERIAGLHRKSKRHRQFGRRLLRFMVQTGARRAALRLSKNRPTSASLVR